MKLVEDFEEAVAEMAFLGSKPPEEHADIEGAYNAARGALAAKLASIEAEREYAMKQLEVVRTLCSRAPIVLECVDRAMESLRRMGQ